MKEISADSLATIPSPAPSSHKGENGVLYIVAGSREYHGALWYAIEAASHFVDLIYVETDTSNVQMVQDLKILHPAMILVDLENRTQYLKKSDAMLLGPGIGRTDWAKQMVQEILDDPMCPPHRVVDADALHFIMENQITLSTVLTPHAGEYSEVFGNEAIEKLSERLPGVFVHKQSTDTICQNGKCEYNRGGNAGLTKGGTGDVLASLIAAFSCRMPVLEATHAAITLIGLTADSLAETSGTHFSTRDLILHLPIYLHSWQQQQ